MQALGAWPQSALFPLTNRGLSSSAFSCSTLFLHSPQFSHSMTQLDLIVTCSSQFTTATPAHPATHPAGPPPQVLNHCWIGTHAPRMKRNRLMRDLLKVEKSLKASPYVMKYLQEFSVYPSVGNTGGPSKTFIFVAVWKILSS